MKATIIFLLLVLSHFVFGQELKQFISYTVPIHEMAIQDMYGKIIKLENDITTDQLEEFAFTRLNVSIRNKMLKTIKDQLYSGKVTAYYVDYYLYGGDVNWETPDKYFKDPIPVESLDTVFAEVYSAPLFDELSGAILYNDEGDMIMTDYIQPYEIEDIVSFTFYEDWIIDEKSNILTKNVTGYTIDVGYRNPDTEEFMGLKSLCYIPNSSKPNKKDDLLAKNLKSMTRVKYIPDPGAYEFYHGDLVKAQWWDNTLLPNVRNQFLGKNKYAPFLSSNVPLEVYRLDLIDAFGVIDITTDFPYSSVISEEGLSFAGGEFVEYPMFDVNTGTILYDEDGMELMETRFEEYRVHEIYALGFIEEWTFNPKTISIHKNIKGVIPIVEYIDPNTGNVLGLKELFCLRYQ